MRLTTALTNNIVTVGICLNAIAGYYHDPIFVPKELAELAMDALTEFLA